MSNPNWTDGGDNWTTASDWSTGAAPSSVDDVLIDQGGPLINSDVGAVNSLNVANDGVLSIGGGGDLTVKGQAEFVGLLVVDDAGAFGQSGNTGPASLTVDGLLISLNEMIIGSGKETVSDTVTASNFFHEGAVALLGGATSAATLDDLGSANPDVALGIGAAAGSDDSNLLYGDVILEDDALLEFGSGQFTGIAQNGELEISGTDAFVADANDKTTDSALAFTSSEGTLLLNDGASLETDAGFVSGQFAQIVLENNEDVSATTTLEINNSAAGVENSDSALDTDVSVSGDSRLEFEGGGQIDSIAEGGSLSLSGANASIADAGATGVNSAIGALTSNAGNLSLSDGASLTTAAGFTDTDADLFLANDDDVATATTFLVNNSTNGFEDSTGALDAYVGVSGDSQLVFEGNGQIASIGEFAELTLSGAKASVADADSSAIDSALNLSSNAGTLTLDDGASLTTAAGFIDTGKVVIENDDDAATPTTLYVNSTAASFEESTGTFDDVVSVSGDSQLVFEGGGQISSIGAYGVLSLSGANASIADAGAAANNSALNLSSNAGALELDDGASLTTAAGFTNTGYIELGNDDDASTITKLVIDNTTAAFGNSGSVLDDVSINIYGDSVLEFEGGGQFSSIGDEGGLSLDGTGAYIEDENAPNSNSAIAALTSNAGYLGLDDGATLTTSANFVNTGALFIGDDSSTTATSILYAGSATSFAPSGTISGEVELGNNARLEFVDGGEITGIGSSSKLGVDGTGAFIEDASALGGNSALMGLASNAGTFILDEGASVTTTGALNNTGEIELSDGSLDSGSPVETDEQLIAAPATSVLDIGSAAGLGTEGTISGEVSLGNNSLLEFKMGQITSIDDEASLSIDGPNAFVADADDLTSNSALKGLATLGDDSTLSVSDSAEVATTGALNGGEYSSLSLATGASMSIGGAVSGVGVISLSGGSAIQTVLDVEASAGFGMGAALTGEVSVSGNSLLEFAQGQLTSISGAGSLVIDGDDAYIADAGSTTSNSALAGLDDIAGFLDLDAGASVTTSGQLVNTGNVDLEYAAQLVVTGTAAGFGDDMGYLDGSLQVSSGAQLDFTQGGQIAGIAAGASLTIDGANSYVESGSATNSNSALAGLTANAGELSLDDGAILSTTGALANTGTIVLGDDYSTTKSATPSILDIGGSADDFGPSGALLGNVQLAGDSLLEFNSGQITSIGSQSPFSYASLSIDGTSAFVADANATTSNSALAGLDDIADGDLTLSDGASVTTSGALNNQGFIQLDSQDDSPGGLVSTLDVGSAAGLGAVGVLNGDVTLTGDSLLEFQSGQITTLAAGSDLTISGANGFIADQGATASSSALAGLDDIAGDLNLDDGASIATDVALDNSGNVSLNYGGGSSAITTLYVGASAATFQSSGDITLGANSRLEFESGQVATIGENSDLTIDGSSAFVADADDTSSNSALTGLDDVAGTLVLEEGASVTTGSLTDSHFIYVEGSYDSPGSTLTVNGTLDDTGFIFLGDNSDDSTPSTVNATALTLNGGDLRIFADGFVNAKTLTIGDDGVLDLQAAASAISGPINFAAGVTGYLEIGTEAVASTGGNFADSIDDFSAGDTIELVGLNYVAGGATTATLSGTTLTVTNGTVTDTLTLNDPGATVGFQTSQDFLGGTDIVIVCFASGTRIRTRRAGAMVEAAVEGLAVGDFVVTTSGQDRPIRWIGHRTIDCRRHPRPAEVMPVRIAAHAFGPDRPARDLVLSPGHAVCVDVLGEVLVTAGSLVNGATIQQLDVDAITYWHVELDSHDVILAENLPTESYLEMGNREFFADGDVVALSAAPDGDPKPRTHADFCRPFHRNDVIVDAVRARLRQQAHQLGWRLSRELDLHLVVDGQRIDPVLRGATARFAAPAGAKDVWLVSPTGRPFDTVGTGDDRELGVCLGGLQIADGFQAPRRIALDDARLGEGFHKFEDGVRRWTSGRAKLPATLWSDCDGAFFLSVELAETCAPRWVGRVEAQRAIAQASLIDPAVVEPRAACA